MGVRLRLCFRDLREGTVAGCMLIILHNRDWCEVLDKSGQLHLLLSIFVVLCKIVVAPLHSVFSILVVQFCR